MNIFQSAILGIIQGLTEFFPISSSGHLILMPKIFGWEEHSLSLDASLHLGTGLAVLVYFRDDWIRMLSSFFGDLKKFGFPNSGFRFPFSEFTSDSRQLIFLGLASIPAALVGALLNNWVEANLRSPRVVALSLFIVAVLMIFAENAVKSTLARPGLSDALAMGVSQVLALIPGVSRSGITITTGLFSGLDLASAARFSFLLSTPIVLGAGIWGLVGIPQTALRGQQITAGFVSAFLSGLLAIKIFLGLLEKVGLCPFALYRIFLAITVWFLLV